MSEIEILELFWLLLQIAFLVGFVELLENFFFCQILGEKELRESIKFSQLLYPLLGFKLIGHTEVHIQSYFQDNTFVDWKFLSLLQV